jgi:Tfp pilus assembly protein PilF
MALLAIGGVASADPFVPADDSRIVLRVEMSPERQELRALEQAVESNPTDLIAAQKLVDACLRIGRRTAEPRYFGRAESLLAPWLGRPHPPEALVLRMADIWQYRHEYERALALIERVLTTDPREPRALLMRAAIRQTQGRFDLARADCHALLAHGEPTLGTVCLAQALSMTGSLSRAERLLASLLERSGGVASSQRVWMLTALADMQERMGRADAAELRLRQALEADASAHYARLALADLLLDHGRAEEIPALLAPMPRTEGTLLRLAEVDRQRSISSSAGKLLERRFAEAAQRGERLHRRDVARLQLRVMRDKAAALALARDNWNEQHEPADARLLAQAAVAAHDGAALTQLQEWRKATGYEDRALDRILTLADRS